MNLVFRKELRDLVSILGKINYWEKREAQFEKSKSFIINLLLERQFSVHIESYSSIQISNFFAVDWRVHLNCGQ